MTNYTDPAPSTVQEWIKAVLAVANAEGMRNDQVIPIRPADLPANVARNYPALTVGALREWDSQQAAAGNVMAWMDAEGDVISAKKKLRMMTSQGAAGVEIATKYNRPLTEPGVSAPSTSQQSVVPSEVVALVREAEAACQDHGGQTLADSRLAQRWLNSLNQAVNIMAATPRTTMGVPADFRQHLEELVSSAYHEIDKDGESFGQDDCREGVDRLMSLLTTNANTPLLDWKALGSEISDYIDGYEFRGDEGDYVPNERENFLMQDMAAGLIEDVLVKALSANPQPYSPVPAGWRLTRESDDRITIDAGGLGFFVARLDAERIADILLYALANDLLLSNTTQQTTDKLPKWMLDHVEKCLLSYRLSQYVDKDGDALPLVDHLSGYGKTVESGKHEIRMICDHIFSTAPSEGVE